MSLTEQGRKQVLGKLRDGTPVHKFSNAEILARFEEEQAQIKAQAEEDAAYRDSVVEMAAYREPRTGKPEPKPSEADVPIPGDVAAFLAGDMPQPPKPVLLHRTDGQALFYSGKLNMLFGDPECGKTWIALAACTEALRKGRRVTFIDLDHNGMEAVVGNLLMLGAPAPRLGDLATFRYYDTIDSAAEMRALVEYLAGTWHPAVAVIDSMGELLPMMGASSNDPDQFTTAHTTVLKPLATARAAVVVIDHLANNQESRRRGSTGAHAKRRSIGGASLRVVLRRTFIPGMGGVCDLYINKDRHGGLRQSCPPSGGGGGEQNAGSFVLETNEGGTTWRVLPPMTLAGPASTLASATQAHLIAIRGLEMDTWTLADAAAAVAGDVPTASQKETARYHIDQLIDKKLVEVTGEKKPGVATRYRLTDLGRTSE